MARPGGPWWWRERSRWAATVQGRRHAAPKDIGERDRSEAWSWYGALVKEAARPTPTTTVADLCNLYLEACRARVARDDLNGDTMDLNARVLTTACGFVVNGRKFGSTPVREVKLSHLESITVQWAARPGIGKHKTISPAYLRTATGIVRTAFRWGVHPGGGLEPLLPADPFARYKTPRGKPADVRICERKDAARWLRWLRSQPQTETLKNFALLQRCLIATGARPSEFYRATWGEIRWEAGRTSSGATYGLLIRADWKNARKSGKPRRIILLPSILRPLRRLYARLKPEAGELIYRSSWGRAWNATLLAHQTKRHRLAAKAAGVELPADEGRIRGYLWRHLAASNLVMSGVDLVTAGDLLGTSPAMIARTYAHLKDDHIVAAAEVLTNGRGGSGRAGGLPRA
ncbi:tyrosine-type recombinase/integrase [Paludisphaera rhizosphaerae]|uniref:tyrosine-type recombinase/integrase n=1 Tax=Paludisphaera rhizosphaerae TaxID=2711216 RepID=UPI0013EE1DB3|nr:tyrosine-type recombinase/integrase [Paludisphaera rhizosphaerae]